MFPLVNTKAHVFNQEGRGDNTQVPSCGGKNRMLPHGFAQKVLLLVRCGSAAGVGFAAGLCPAVKVHRVSGYAGRPGNPKS